jgi:alcohol dehydrogenase class IV
MSTEGRVVFGKMDEVVFGKPAAAAIAEQTRRLGSERIFLMVSGTLNRDTDEIAKIRAALGNRCVGVFDKMPPHTPRSAVIAGRPGEECERGFDRDGGRGFDHGRGEGGATVPRE